MTRPKLTVYIDFKSPYAYIAKDPTFWLKQAYGIELDVYPLTLNIASYLGSARKSDSGKVVENNRSPKQWLAVKYAYKDARRYAALRGLTLKGTQKIWDSSLSGIGLMWAKMQSHEVMKAYIDRVYEQFWKRELDIEDPEVIVRELSLAGVDTAGFDDYRLGPGKQEYDELQQSLFESGYFGVPTYVIDDQVYFGREHLPRVRWHLEGCPGDMPDIAYDSLPPEAVEHA